jgi:hypothetical protein
MMFDQRMIAVVGRSIGGLSSLKLTFLGGSKHAVMDVRSFVKRRSVVSI